MSSNQDIVEKRHALTECEDKYICKVRRNDHNYRQVYEYDKKMKREIANSNERRRMQSINMGFETLKQLLPMAMDGEKLSKASILQFTAKYIQSLIARISTLEKEVASYKRNMLNAKEKVQSSKSSTPVVQEINRKRRLNSCTGDFEIAQIDKNDPKLDCVNNCDYSVLNQENVSINCQTSEKIPGSLEHLVAAIEQVEGEKFYLTPGNNKVQSQQLKDQSDGDSSKISEANCEWLEQVEQSSNSSNANVLLTNNKSTDGKKQQSGSNGCKVANSFVMKPIISPYTEKIILAVSQHPHMFENRSSSYNLNIATQPTYQIISNEQLITSTGFSNSHFIGS